MFSYKYFFSFYLMISSLFWLFLHIKIQPQASADESQMFPSE